MLDRRQIVAAPFIAAPLAAARATTVPPAAWPSPERFPLWPGGLAGRPAMPAPAPAPAPRASTRLHLDGVAEPFVCVYRPGRSNGTALLVIPGGGYRYLSVTNEGTDVADAFCPLGHTVFVLAYRLPGEGWPDRSDVPLADARQAVRLIRTRAAAFGIRADRVVALGFSAGGHLAASLATAPAGFPAAYDASAGGQVDRPDAAALIYPVLTLEAPNAHAGSRLALLGTDPSPARIELYSPLAHVDAATPPCFLTHAIDDPVVPVQGSVDWMTACRARRVPIEAYFPQEGGHGFGTAARTTLPAACWPTLFDRWLTRRFARG